MDILLAVVGVLGTGVLGFLTALATGQLVPGSRVTEYQTTIGQQQSAIARLTDSNEQIKKGYEDMKSIVDRQQMLQDVTAAAMRAVRDAQGAAAPLTLPSTPMVRTEEAP